ncbi:MAG: carbohydrate kinase family protein [Chloroflexota bacterium]
MPIRTPNILSLGDLLLDVVVRYDPLSGEADAGADAVQLWPGGSAANFAVWAARLDANVRYISRVGRDLPGDMLLYSLEEAGITPAVRVVEGATTGRVLVMVDSEGNRRMWSYPGASGTIAVEDLDPAWFSGLDAFHLTGYSLLREGPRAAALEALRLARASGTPICSLDPNPPHLIVEFGVERYREMLAQAQFDIIIPNLEEGILLTGENEPEAIAAGLLMLSPLVVLTLAEQGCIVATREETARYEAHPVESMLDATGGGDAFAAGFVVEYLRTRDLPTAARSANRLAASVVSRVGAR